MWAIDPSRGRARTRQGPSPELEFLRRACRNLTDKTSFHLGNRSAPSSSGTSPWTSTPSPWSTGRQCGGQGRLRLVFWTRRYKSRAVHNTRGLETHHERNACPLPPRPMVASTDERCGCPIRSTHAVVVPSKIIARSIMPSTKRPPSTPKSAGRALMRCLLKHHITLTIALHKRRKSNSRQRALVIDHDEFTSAPPSYLACAPGVWPTSLTRLRHSPCSITQAGIGRLRVEIT